MLPTVASTQGNQFVAGVNSTSDAVLSGVNDDGGQFVAGVDDTATLLSCVNDNSDQFVDSVNATSEDFLSGINYSGDQIVSGVNDPYVVSMTTVIDCRWCG